MEVSETIWFGKQTLSTLGGANDIRGWLISCQVIETIRCGNSKQLVSFVAPQLGIALANSRALCERARSLIPAPAPLFAGPVNFRVNDTHVPSQSIIAGERLFLGAQMAADLLLTGVVDRILVPRQVVWSREDRPAWLACLRVDPVAPVGTGLGVA
jgi:hypothetical protein